MIGVELGGNKQGHQTQKEGEPLQLRRGMKLGLDLFDLPTEFEKKPGSFLRSKLEGRELMVSSRLLKERNIDPELFNTTIERFLNTKFVKKDRINDRLKSYERLLA